VNRGVTVLVLPVLVFAALAAAVVLGAEVTRHAIETCTEGRPRTTPDPGITIDWHFLDLGYTCVYGTGPTARHEPPP
jgi:hypothetical protein